MSNPEIGNDFTHWLLLSTTTLIAAGVIGLWRLSNVVSQLQTTVSNWTKVFEDRFVAITHTSGHHEARIGSLEKTTAVHTVLIDRFELAELATRKKPGEGDKIDER